MTDGNRELVPDSWSLVRRERWLLDFVQKDGILHIGCLQKNGAAGKECKCEVLKGRWGLDEK